MFRSKLHASGVRIPTDGYINSSGDGGCLRIRLASAGVEDGGNTIPRDGYVINNGEHDH